MTKKTRTSKPLPCLFVQQWAGLSTRYQLPGTGLFPCGWKRTRHTQPSRRTSATAPVPPDQGIHQNSNFSIVCPSYCSSRLAQGCVCACRHLDAWAGYVDMSVRVSVCVCKAAPARKPRRLFLRSVHVIPTRPRRRRIFWLVGEQCKDRWAPNRGCSWLTR